MAQRLTAWNSGLLDCFTDLKSCCYGFWCCPCFACSTSASFGENRCLPMCDICSPAVLSAFGIPLAVPPALLALRVAVRHKYGIKGDICTDILTACFCEWCAWCQLSREINYHKKNPTTINVQPTSHPPPAGFVG
ncbi:placenta-specific gene 8 protein-like [Thalassophryne amazonica]|uniref:placenta-specific gene 8 protein-like n=1 Tax=Thalassophryne amazonica TaxID=390379 RepID=UPI0014725FCE|nr:placenta-specific gene 8 protein-like [Thalassophryne amazonica]